MTSGQSSFNRRGTFSFVVPRRFRLPLLVLKLLCLIPSIIGVFDNLPKALASHNGIHSPSSGIFEYKSTPLIHKVALLWCLLAGYWSWVFTTSMLNRWLHHYELSSVIVRLITLNVINWSVSAFLGSHYGIDQPIWKWMTICLIFLISNLLKKKFAATTPSTTTISKMEGASNNISIDLFDGNKKSTGSNSSTSSNSAHQWSTMVRVLILPLTLVVFITMFALLYQVGQLRKESIVLAEKRMAVPVAEPHPGLNNDAEVRVMVFVLSAWTAKGVVKRKEFRETTLQLMPDHDNNNNKISYFYKFILGQPPENNELVKKNVMPLVEKEMKEFGDVLILNCSDRYEDLSRKVYSAFEWANQYDFDYFIKTDDDIFVRWDTISKELELAGRTHRYWRGLAYWNIPPIRNTENKNSELVYPLPIFPPFTAGALYILSRDIVHLVAGVKGPRLFVKNEDQNLGLWLFPFNILPIHDRRIQQIDVCEDDMIGKHFGDFGEPDAIGGTMYDMLDNLRQGRRMCHGFKTSVCAMCYPCHGKANHWRGWGFDCDSRKGVTLLNMPQLTVME